MRITSILLTAWALVAPLGAQPPAFSPLEVGVEEKLGQPVRLDTALLDEEGHPIKLGSLIDKPTLLSLNYFRCAGVCTPQLIGILEAVGQVQAKPGEDFQVITVSFDERDTHEMAWQKRNNFLSELKRPIPPTAWRFLTGRAAESKALCDSVGFRFKAAGDDFVHAAVLVALSPHGKITRYLYGVSYVPAELQTAILEAGRGEARPTVNKWLKFCYASDSSGKGAVFSATRLAASLTLLAAAAFAIVLVLSSRRRRRRNSGGHI